MTHKATAYAQFALTLVFLIGYFVVLRAFLQGRATVDPAWKDTVQALISVLTAGVIQILGYWFSRQRSSGDPPTKETQ